jgi:hypothetical protein
MEGPSLYPGRDIGIVLVQGLDDPGQGVFGVGKPLLLVQQATGGPLAPSPTPFMHQSHRDGIKPPREGQHFPEQQGLRDIPIASSARLAYNMS